VTHDISAGGLFISSSRRPPAGAFATLEILLPVRGLCDQRLQLHGTGRVVRLIEDGPRSGFAIAGTPSWTLARNKNQMAVKVN
jgi:hypothetical protein